MMTIERSQSHAQQVKIKKKTHSLYTDSKIRTSSGYMTVCIRSSIEAKEKLLVEGCAKASPCVYGATSTTMKKNLLLWYTHMSSYTRSQSDVSAPPSAGVQAKKKPNSLTILSGLSIFASLCPK